MNEITWRWLRYAKNATERAHEEWETMSPEEQAQIIRESDR